MSPTECGHTLDVSGSVPRGEFLADETMGFCRSSVFSGSRVLVHSIRASRCSVSGAFPHLPSILLFHQPGSNPAWDVCATHCLPLHTLSQDIGVEELEGCSSTSEHCVVSGHIKDLLLYSVRRWCALLLFDKLFRKQWKSRTNFVIFVFQFSFNLWASASTFSCWKVAQFVQYVTLIQICLNWRYFQPNSRSHSDSKEVQHLNKMSRCLKYTLNVLAVLWKRKLSLNYSSRQGWIKVRSCT